VPKYSHPVPPAGADLPQRHREVLREALVLFAERGYAGASLRELARRIGMQQPSLYHYFRSKEELVEQVLSVYGFGGIASQPSDFVMPERIEDLPRALASLVRHLYGATDWPIFVRFMFNLALEQPRYGARLRAMFVDTTQQMMDAAVVHYADQIDPREAQLLFRMVLNAIALLEIEEKLLFAKSGVHPDLDEYTDFVVRVAEQALASRKERSIFRESRPLPADRRTPARARRAAR
jgi:AcrR family transcriptional regulator